jgi:hypothetical protein
MRPDYVRLPVSSADLNNLVRVHGNVIEALTGSGAFEGQVYPALSSDDGGSWVIDGPRFNGAGVSGGSQTDHLTVSRDRTLMAWGRFGNSVWTRSAAEHHWRGASLGQVLRATTAGRQLVVRVQGPLEYVSDDDGSTWRRVTAP